MEAQVNFGEIINVESEGGGYCSQVGDFKLSMGYRKGRIELQWPDNTTSEHDYIVQTIEPGGSNHPYNHITFVFIDFHGVQARTDLDSFVGKAKGRILSMEHT